jgi:hypothetical protein
MVRVDEPWDIWDGNVGAGGRADWDCRGYDIGISWLAICPLPTPSDANGLWTCCPSKTRFSQNLQAKRKGKGVKKKPIVDDLTGARYRVEL